MPPEQNTVVTEEQPEEVVEETTEPDEVDDSADDVDTDDPNHPDFWQNKAKKNGNEAKNLRARLKEAEKAAAEALKELTPLKAKAKADAEKDMTDLDLANARIKDLLEETTTLRRATWMAEVDKRWDLPKRAKDSLVGDTPEEFMAAADEWAADLGLERLDKSPRRTKAAPTELSGGRNAGKEPALTAAQQLAKAVEEKDFRRAAQIKASQLAVLMHA